LQHLVDLRVSSPGGQLLEDEPARLLIGERRIHVLHARHQQRVHAFAATAGVITQAMLAYPHRRLEALLVAMAPARQPSQFGAMAGHILDHCPAQSGTTRNLGKTQSLSRLIGQRMEDRGKKVVPAPWDAVERFPERAVRLIDRPALDQVVSLTGAFAAKAVDQRPVDTAFAYFQTHFVRPARQPLQGAQGQPLAVAAGRIFHVQTGNRMVETPQPGIFTGDLQQPQGYPPTVLQTRQFLGVRLEQYTDCRRTAQPRRGGL